MKKCSFINNISLKESSRSREIILLSMTYVNTSKDSSSLKNNKSFLTPTIGNDKLMRDPCIIYGPDKKFHMVYTVSWRERSIGYAYSTDLINWSKQLKIPVMMHEENALNCWAPEIYYDSISKKYVIIDDLISFFASETPFFPVAAFALPAFIASIFLPFIFASS